MTATPAVDTPAKKAKSSTKPAPETKPEAAKSEPVSAPKTVKLPAELRGNHDEFVKALATPVPAVWDDEVTYVDAKQPEAIAKVLIRVLHHALTNAKIAFVFRKAMKQGDAPLLGKASKIGGKLNYFSGLQLLVEVNHDKWKNLSAERRIALIDHELTHFTRGESSYEMVEHDIEEFGSIVRRWGFWTADVERFATAIDRAKQLDIFAAPIAAAATSSAVN